MTFRIASVLFLARVVVPGLGLTLGCRAPAEPQPMLATSPVTTANKLSPLGGSSGSNGHFVSKPFPPPEADLPADRLHEHVDGAEPLLQSLGCRRLLFWHLSNPSVDLEIMVFNTEAGAGTALDKDSGSARTSGVPGDEGWTNQQVVYFRHGTSYCRLIADQLPPVIGLSEQAFRVDKALASGEISP